MNGYSAGTTEDFVLNSVFFGGQGNLYVVLGLVASIFLAGYLVLSQHLHPAQLVGMVLVVVASAAVTRAGPPPSTPEGAAEVG